MVSYDIDPLRHIVFTYLDTIIHPDAVDRQGWMYDWLADTVCDALRNPETGRKMPPQHEDRQPPDILLLGQPQEPKAAAEPEPAGLAAVPDYVLESSPELPEVRPQPVSVSRPLAKATPVITEEPRYCKLCNVLLERKPREPKQAWLRRQYCSRDCSRKVASAARSKSCAVSEADLSSLTVAVRKEVIRIAIHEKQSPVPYLVETLGVGEERAALLRDAILDGYVQPKIDALAGEPSARVEAESRESAERKAAQDYIHAQMAACKPIDTTFVSALTQLKDGSLRQFIQSTREVAAHSHH